VSVCLGTGSSCANADELFVELCKSWRVPYLVSFKRWSRLNGTRHLPVYRVTILFKGEYNFANHSLKVQVKVKFTPEQATKAQRGI
jgi:hypothetical protein